MRHAFGRIAPRSGALPRNQPARPTTSASFRRRTAARGQAMTRTLCTQTRASCGARAAIASTPTPRASAPAERATHGGLQNSRQWLQPARAWTAARGPRLDLRGFAQCRAGTSPIRQSRDVGCSRFVRSRSNLTRGAYPPTGAARSVAPSPMTHGAHHDKNLHAPPVDGRWRQFTLVFGPRGTQTKEVDRCSHDGTR
jgi:hypothetical protein